MNTSRARVGDVLRLQRRAVEVKIDQEYDEIGIRSFGRGIFHKERMSGASLGSKRVFRIEPGDLVISNVFAWEGAIAFASKADADRIGSHRFMTFVPADERIDASWAMWFFRSEAGQELIGEASPGSAGRNRTLAIERFEALEIPLPPIEEQRRVAERLGRVSDRSAELRKRFDRAEQLSSALAVSMSTRRDLDDTDRAHAAWRRVPLGRFLARSTRQVNVDAGEQYRIAGIYSFGRGLIDRGPIYGTETAYKTLTVLDEGDVVVSKLNGWEGAVAVVDAAFAGHCVSSEFPSFKPDRTQLRSDFFRGIARSPWFWDALNTNTRGSMVRRRRINSTEFLATEVWLPAMGEQARLARLLSMLDDGKRVRRAATARIEALMPATLNEAFAKLS